MKRMALIGLGFFLFSAFLPAAGDLTPAQKKGLATIQWQDVYGYCRQLAGETFGGRYTGTPDYAAMAAWAAERFRAWGLKPVDPKAGYFQSFASPYTIVDRAELIVTTFEKPKETGAEPAARETKLKLEEEFLPYISSGKAEISAATVFVGWGIAAPELGYDDYAGVDVRGKIVLHFSGTPDPDNENFFAYRRKVRQMAHDRGAVGMVTIAKPTGHPSSENWIEGFPVVMISEAAADPILAERGIKSADLKKALETYRRPIAFPLQAKIALKVDSRRFPDGKGLNIVGKIEGSDPARREECVIVGAHGDHMGRICGILYPGADDNASGSAVVMEIAEAFAKMGGRPKRSVLFALFGGEEISILGAKHMAEHLPAPFKKVALMVNFDMVGIGDKAWSGCSTSPEELKPLIEALDKQVGVIAGEVRRSDPKTIGGTDHTAFAVTLKCPTAAFFSNGPHPQYHTSADTIYRVNPDIMAQIARLAFLMSTTWADR